MLIISMLFLFGNPDLPAQKIPIKRSHAISQPEPQLIGNLNAKGTLDVIAIMVEFQPDSNRLTSGTGIFGADGMDGLPYLRRAEDFRVEPLPHDRNYFEAHLEFAKNYYEKASDEQLTIDYQLLPDIYQLSKKMEEYSPTGETFTNEKIAELIRDAWKKVEEGGGIPEHITTDLNPDSTAFVIFHAGVGRDIELTGTNLDITPLDIPSIYLRKENIGNLLDDPGFNGFEINDDGTFRVTNSLIIPRTESRRGLDIQDNEFVFPLSINGLLIASIGSHLGLPDLFNTETGEPAIGRFGLMDGAGFFAYNGLLPPEPSAWEKIHLGWESPFLIDTETTGDIPLPASSLNQPNSIAKYKLSESEYFLIENRHRDPDGSGITITTRKPDGTTEVQQTFTNQDEAFVFQEADFDDLLEAGSFVNATNFDFSLPGGLDTGENENDDSDDRNLNGGILIWHIDESVIESQLQNSQVNADPDRRGVDLEEADGAQDIGLGTPGSIDNSAAFGTPFDFWWSGNNYRVILQTGQEISFYENRFGPDTRPDNSSNSGAKSFFELHDFSENLPVASFQVKSAELQDLGFELLSSTQTQYDEDYYTDENSYWDYFPLSIKVVDFFSDTILVIPTNDGIQVGSLHPVSYGGRISFGGVTTQPLPIAPNYLVFSNIITETVGIRAWDPSTVSWPGWSLEIPLSTGFVSSQDGEIVDLDFTTTSIQGTTGDELQNNSGYEFRSEIVNSKFVGINGNTVSFVGENIPDYISTAENRLFAGTIKSNQGNYYYLFEDGTFSIVNPAQEDPITFIFEEEKAEWPAIMDEGRILRINRSESSIEGYNFNGAFLDNTPIYAPEDIQFIGTPLLADITGDNIQDILVVGQDDYSVNIFAYELTGEPIKGFPLYVGGTVDAQTQPIHPVIYENKLYAVSHRGDLKAWEFKNFTSSQWPSRYGANPYNKVSGDITFSTPTEPSFSVLNKTETYNWPNPANDRTHIRFELAKPGGTVEIQVITMGGRIVFEETVTSPGGFPQEVQVNTQHWGSGGYIARVKALVEGKTEIKLIKIGVVH